MKKTIMSFKEAHNFALHSTPRLYYGKTLTESKLKFLDYITNTVGNGLYSAVNFINIYGYDSKFDLKINLGEPKKEYTNGSKIYVVNNKPGLYNEIEIQGLNSNEYYKLSHKTWHPYPNFKKEYSPIWIYPEIFNEEWLTEIQFFYEYCLGYLNSKYIYDAFDGIPQSDNSPRWPSVITEQEKMFMYCLKDKRKDETDHECISRVYNTEYNGNTKELIISVFHNENNRRIAFCEETIEKIKTLINEK